MKSKISSAIVFAFVLALALGVGIGGISAVASDNVTEILPAVGYELGDVNLDKAVNIKDATAIQKYVAGLISFAPLQEKLADADSSTSVNIKDATYIQKQIAGLIGNSGPTTEESSLPMWETPNTTTAPAMTDNTEATERVTEAQTASPTEAVTEAQTASPTEDVTESSATIDDEDSDKPITLPFVPAS